MPDLFISYSRRNLEFVQQLFDALTKNGKDPWFDQLKEPLSGIAAGAPWWKQIQEGIESVDNFLFVISPNSISSPYCHAEINYARERGKRLVPLLYCGSIAEAETRKAIDAAIEAIPDGEELPDVVTSSILNLKKLVRQNWLAVSEIQYVVFASSIAFEQSLEQLVQALDLDLAWVRMHSQLVQAAKLWEASGFDEDYLWRANRLKAVYEMIERRQSELDPLVRNFIKPEHERLLTELEDINTSHQRRAEIGERLAVIGDTRRGIGLRADGLPDIVWCPVPGGEVILKLHAHLVGDDNPKIAKFLVASFYVAKYPITYMQFQAFLDDKDTGFDSDAWWQGLKRDTHYPMEEPKYKYDNHPRGGVNWYQAVAFCRWLTAKLPHDARPSAADKDWIIRLPTEWEWQQAVTGGREDYMYPWGVDWDESRANTAQLGTSRTLAVGMYPGGASPGGALDMIGNSWEWCLNEYGDLKRVGTQGDADRALRGGQWNFFGHYAPEVSRLNDFPTSNTHDNGLRVVVGAAL